MTDHDIDDLPAPEGRNPVSDEAWAAAREYYWLGLSAPQICQWLGVGLSTFRARAAKEGWRRCDRAELTPVDLDTPDALDPSAPDPADAATLADRAYRRMAAAVDRGRLQDAAGWLRVHDRLRRLADPRATPAEMREIEKDVRQVGRVARTWTAAAEAQIALMDAGLLDASDASDGSDGVFPDPPSKLPDPPQTRRARRRAAALARKSRAP